MEEAPAPRLCHVIKWSDFDGYGFNLHGGKTQPGQFIGKVDAGSPAEYAGLRPNDRIIEVNGVNISNENHKQVVQRIKAVPNETKLLVLDEKGDLYYKARDLVPKGTQDNVIYIKTPDHNPNNGNSANEEDERPSPIPINNVRNGSSPDVETNGHGEVVSDDDRKSHISDSGSGGSSFLSKENSLKADSHNGDMKDSMDDYPSSSGPSPSPTSTATPSPTPVITSNKIGGLDLNMTVQEMRAKLAAKKKEKIDAKNQKIDLQKKYQIIQTL